MLRNMNKQRKETFSRVRHHVQLMGRETGSKRTAYKLDGASYRCAAASAMHLPLHCRCRYAAATLPPSFRRYLFPCRC